MLPLKFHELMAWINYVSVSIDVSDEKQYTLLNLLFSIQQNLDAVYKLIKETKGLIFKLPEIQQFYEKDIREEEDCTNEDIDEEDCIDEIEEHSGNFEISDEDF
uniref:Uncharacterized protein n=1 Tax=Panagrolaimus superbus TaxID=310955 RepID=A0A914Z3Z9_9BILA